MREMVRSHTPLLTNSNLIYFTYCNYHHLLAFLYHCPT